MKHTLIYMATAAALFLAAGCNEPYDPIGPNMPSPVLLINPLEHGFDGTGGSASSKISTNADEVTVESVPDWIASAEVNADNTQIDIVAMPNTTGEIRRGVIKLQCASGDNFVNQYIKIVEAQNGRTLAYFPFSGKKLPDGMVADDKSKLAIGNGYLAFTAEGDPGYLYHYDRIFDPKKGFTMTLDVKMAGEGGVKLFTHDDNEKTNLAIYFGYNASRNTGGIWVKNGETWCAMDDGTIGGSAGKPGSGAIPGNQSEEVFLIPDAAEREDWWRLEVTHEPNTCDYIVAIRTLKTFNGETNPLLCHYARKFEALEKMDKGTFAIWARNFENQYKNFIISYQE